MEAVYKGFRIQVKLTERWFEVVFQYLSTPVSSAGGLTHRYRLRAGRYWDEEEVLMWVRGHLDGLWVLQDETDGSVGDA